MEPIPQHGDRSLGPDLLVFVGSIDGTQDVDVMTALSALGMPVRRVGSTEEARACVRFLSVRMLVVGLDDGQDGWSLIRRTARERGNIPVACLSSAATRSRVLGAVRRGARAFLVPPVDGETIRRVLLPLLNDGEPQDEPSIFPPHASLEELAS